MHLSQSAALYRHETFPNALVSIPMRRSPHRVPRGGRPDCHAMAIPRPFPRLLPQAHRRRDVIDEPTGCGKRRAGPILAQHQKENELCPSSKFI